MKNLSDYEKTQSATVDLPCGAFKNESSPGQKDGTDILAEHIQDLAYPLYQVLQLAGEVPNGELEDGNNKKQFLQALCNIGFFKYSATSVYAKGNIVLQNIDGSLSLYRSLISNNNFDLSDVNSWKKLLTVENNNRINFHVETNIGGGSGSNMPVFCFNSGPVDANGNPTLLTLDNNIIIMHAPAVCTSAGGETFTVSEDVSIDISELEAGTYNIFYNPETNGLETYQNTLFWQKAKPENWNVNDIWVDDSIQPRKSYMKKSDTDFAEVKIVPNAVATILSVGGRGQLIVKPYNAFRCLLKSEFDAEMPKKADINLSNTTKTANTKIAHCAMPSKTRVANIFGSSLTTAYKTYTAPADGEIDIVASSDEYNALNILINDVTVCWQGTSAVGKTRTTFNRVVSKGDVIKAKMDTRATTTLISYFNYANGTV